MQKEYYKCSLTYKGIDTITYSFFAKSLEEAYKSAKALGCKIFNCAIGEICVKLEQIKSEQTESEKV